MKIFNITLATEFDFPVSWVLNNVLYTLESKVDPDYDGPLYDEFFDPIAPVGIYLVSIPLPENEGPIDLLSGQRTLVRGTGPPNVNSFLTGNIFSINLVADQNFLYTLNSANGLIVYDTQINAGQLTPVGQIDISSDAYGLALFDEYIYIFGDVVQIYRKIPIAE
jgi:hypothetical protein